MITLQMIKTIQMGLNKIYNVQLTIDGLAGNNTINTIRNFIPSINSHWIGDRRLTAAIQYLCAAEKIDAGPIDGLMGPQTEYGYELLEAKLLNNSLPEPWRDDEGIGGVEDGTWPLQTEEQLTKFYGAVGTNQTKIISPYPMKIAWDTSKTITRFTCHEKVKDSIERVLKNVLDHYGLEKIKELQLDYWGGCLNVRKMRGGTKWSTHSWGIAIDFDPSRNKLRWKKDKANFAKPEYEVWNDIWEAEGAVSLGRERNFDWMHYQFARVK